MILYRLLIVEADWPYGRGEVPYCSGAFQRDGEKHLTWLARDQLDILKVSREVLDPPFRHLWSFFARSNKKGTLGLK